MKLSGDLKDFSLADVLQLLLQQRKSGVLNLVNGKEKAEIFISAGNVNGVRVNGLMPEDIIKDMLVASGKVDKDEMHELESMSREMNRPLLMTLAAKGHLTDEDKKEWLQIISEDLVCELFGWLKGQYDFGTGLKAQSSISLQLNISTEFACMEGMRRIDEWPRLKESIPDFKTVFQVTEKVYEGDQLGWDFLVLGLVDGRKSVSQIAKQVPFGAFRLSECLVNLWEGGFVAPVADSVDEIDIAVAPDPQNEKDRKTAMVLGTAFMFFLVAIAVRALSFWFLSLNNSPSVKGSAGVGYEAEMANHFGRDNIEVFLLDHAIRKNNLPADLNELVKDGTLVPREITIANGNKPVYKKINKKSYQLK
jgi:hypothetical protein